MFDVGRVCLKTAGREAGRYCVVVKKLEGNFVLVTGPREVTGIKRRKCSIGHLEPLAHTVQIGADADDEQVAAAFERAGLFAALKLEKPTEEKLREMRERRHQKEARKAEAEDKKKAAAGKQKEEKKKEKPKKDAAKQEKPRPEDAAGERLTEKEAALAEEIEQEIRSGHS
jgi:large subunit ribosomal protein L14e